MVTARIIGTGSCLLKNILDNKELSKLVPDYDEKLYPRGFNLESWKEKRLSEGTDISKWKREDFFNDWAIKVSGIERRPIYKSEFDNLPNFKGAIEHMAKIAAENALEMSKVPAEKLECIILNTFSQKYDVPNAAVIVGNLIKVKNLEKLLKVIENKIDGSKIELANECPGEYEMFLRGFTVKIREHGGNEYLLIVSGEDKETNLEIETSKTNLQYSLIKQFLLKRILPC